MNKKVIISGILATIIATVFGLYKLVEVLGTNCDVDSSSYACKFLLFYSGGNLGVDQGKHSFYRFLESFYSGGNLGVDQGNLILLAFALMLIVVIPVLIMSVAFPLWYSNKDADYQPNWSHSSVIEFFAWGIPILIIAVLGYTTYITSHSMDPRKSLVGKYEGAEQKEVVIQAVSMDWKWVFFYPDQDIATVNEIAIPVNTPIKFQITSDTVMNSFFIPELGSQIYAMGGMENRLHLISKRIKTMRGISANYSGFGFSGMKFNVISTDKKGFENWIKKVKSSNVKFDQAAYSRLKGKQTKDHRVEYFSDVVDSEQFENIIRKYLKTH